MKVVVVGGGIIGLACARALSRRGAEVVVVERDRCGEATSRGNGGWVVPALSAPLPAPGVVVQALRWMAKRDSPFLVRPRLDLGFALWCWRFWRSSGQAQFTHGLRAVVRLNLRTLELYDELREDGVAFEMHTNGIIFTATTPAALAEYSHVLAEIAGAGYVGQVEELDRELVREREPALADTVVGGIHAKDERYVRPESLARGLLEALRRAGVTVVEHSPVTALARTDGRWRLETPGAAYEADRVVVAGGIWTASILRLVGSRLPLEGAKGYSVTAVGRGTAPRHALYLIEAKVGCTPFESAVRLSGTLELAGLDLSLNRRRLDALVRASSTYLRDWEPVETELEWAGLRPLAPDGLPLIGQVPGREGIYVATGHGMLGVTMAPATAAALAPLVLEGRQPPELAPFSLERL